MPHTPLYMSGPKDGTKRMGVYTADEVKAWIAGKLGLSTSHLRSRGSNISMVVTDFMSGRGKPTSGPNTHKPGTAAHKKAPKSHASKYRGQDVYHTSAGKAGSANGVTIFYVNAQGRDGKIIGIGRHLTSTSYSIEWSVGDWHVGRTLQLA